MHHGFLTKFLLPWLTCFMRITQLFGSIVFFSNVDQSQLVGHMAIVPCSQHRPSFNLCMVESKLLLGLILVSHTLLNWLGSGE